MKDPTPSEKDANRPSPLVQPIIDDLVSKQKPSAAPPKRPQPAELDQDAGGGFNPDHTDPQP